MQEETYQETYDNFNRLWKFVRNHLTMSLMDMGYNHIYAHEGLIEVKQKEFTDFEHVSKLLMLTVIDGIKVPYEIELKICAKDGELVFRFYLMR